MPSLTIAARTAGAGALTVSVGGEIDLSTADQLRQAVLAAITTDGVTSVELDFADVSFLDSSGISALVAGHLAAGSGGVRLRVAGCQPRVRQVLELTGVAKVLLDD